MIEKELIQKISPEHLKKSINKYKNLWQELINEYEIKYQLCSEREIQVQKNRVGEFKKYLNDIKRIENKLEQVEIFMISILFEDIEKHSKKFWDVMEYNDFEKAVEKHKNNNSLSSKC